MELWCLRCRQMCFWDCYLSYNRGQMEYSDMVKELERKVNTYLNE